jgi:hypothetical protein
MVGITKGTTKASRRGVEQASSRNKGAGVRDRGSVAGSQYGKRKTENGTPTDMLETGNEKLETAYWLLTTGD